MSDIVPANKPPSPAKRLPASAVPAPEPKPAPVRVMHETVYLKASGRIVGHLVHSGNATVATAEKATIAGKLDSATQYVDMSTSTQAPRLRPINGATIDRTRIAANGIDQATISSLASNATVSIDGAKPVPVTDGTIEFSATVPGVYIIVVSAFPALDAHFEVTAS